MKTKNFLFAGAIALSTVLSPMAALTQAVPALAATVELSDTTHSYTAYKIFDGEETVVDGKAQLSNIDWADGVHGDDILKAIKDSKDANLDPLKQATSAPTLADALQKASGNSDVAARAFAKLLNEKIALLGDPEDTDVTSGKTLTVGYYLLRDNTTSSEQDVVGLSILKVATNNGTVTIEPKNSKPGVDKQVWDNDSHDIKAPAANPGTSDEAGFGESADHFVGEQFEFKLNTTGLTYKTVRAYDKYYLEFNDSWTEGITVEATGNDGGEAAKNITVEVKTTNNTVDKTSDFKIVVDQTKKTLNVSIENLKTVLPDNMTDADAIEVVVTYKAHLNENAVAFNETMDNKNDVELIYSNNPNTNGHGTSEKDNVFVGTFKLENTKVDADGKALAEAGFKLKNAAGKFAKFKTTDDKRNVFDGWDDEGKQIISDSEGHFYMEGLDAGTYTLVETKVPDGYKQAADTTIVINATHSENTEGDAATVTVTGEHANGATVTNSKISNLPETGGMGTTMIYSVGTILVAGAAIVFATNKRMRKED